MIGGVIAMRMILCLLLVGILMGCSGSDDAVTDLHDPGFETFASVDGEICREDGKPVIRLFSTTWCPHCQWIADTYDDVVEQYVDDGEIVAHHWQVDTGDDTLTGQVEQQVPDSEEAVFAEFNPAGSIPTFVFGCKYYRVGNGYEQEDDLALEAAEFMDVIEALISE